MNTAVMPTLARTRRFVLLAATAAAAAAAAAAAGPYSPTWPSVTTHPNPAWYGDAKFGIYAHWGPYSVPAFGTEWYSRNMYVPGSPENSHHVATFGELNDVGYKDLAARFTAANFSATAWAALYRRAGAQYAGPVAEHADGFAMWRSNVSHFNAFEVGPRRDVVGELLAAVRAEGLRTIVTLHHHWLVDWYPTFNASLNRDAGDADFQLSPAHGGLYGPPVAEADWRALCCCGAGCANSSQIFMDYWLNKTLEAVSYMPDVAYFDSRTCSTVDDAHRLAFMAAYYNAANASGQGGVVTYKTADFAVGSAVPDVERGGYEAAQSFIWQTDDALDRNSWSWVEPPSLKNATELVGELCDIVSKNGNFLLDIPPHADGSIDPRVEATLLQMGAWLGTNGAAVFATVPWSVAFGEGPTNVVPGAFHEFPLFTPLDFRFTASRDASAVFLLAMAHGEPGTTYAVATLNSTSLPGLTEVTLIGAIAAVPWTQNASGLFIGAIDEPPPEDRDLPMAFRLHLGGASAAQIDAPSAAARARIRAP